MLGRRKRRKKLAVIDQLIVQFLQIFQMFHRLFLVDLIPGSFYFSTDAAW